MNWIKVTDRLPENRVEVLIFFGGDIVQAYKDQDYWKGSRIVTDNMNDGYVQDRRTCKIGGDFDFVTHWMPLPEPPKSEL